MSPAVPRRGEGQRGETVDTIVYASTLTLTLMLTLMLTLVLPSILRSGIGRDDK